MDANVNDLRRNLELKARCRDLAMAAARAGELGVRRVGTLKQVDTYFHVPHGRLKLREIEGQSAELIWYERPDSVEFRGSDYHVVPISHASLTKMALAQALGIRGQVRKHRELMMWHNVRIHLDEVEGLGSFIEFEAVISADADEEVSATRLATLKDALRIADEDRVAVGYLDLLRSAI